MVVAVVVVVAAVEASVSTRFSFAPNPQHCSGKTSACIERSLSQVNTFDWLLLTFFFLLVYFSIARPIVAIQLNLIVSVSVALHILQHPHELSGLVHVLNLPENRAPQQRSYTVGS